MLKIQRHFFSRTHYEVLRVSPQASLEEIKKSFRKIVKEIHPDIRKNSKEMGNEFKKVVEAYQVLKNPSKRHIYDLDIKVVNNTINKGSSQVHKQTQAKWQGNQQTGQRLNLYSEYTFLNPDSNIFNQIAKRYRLNIILVGLAFCSYEIFSWYQDYKYQQYLQYKRQIYENQGNQVLQEYLDR